MLMVGFQKKLLDLKKQINNNSDDFGKRLVGLEGTVVGNSNKIKKVHDTTNWIERQMWLNRHKATENHSEAMKKMTELFDKLNYKIDKISQTQEPIFPNVEHNQLNNSANSNHNHEYNMFEKSN